MQASGQWVSLRRFRAPPGLIVRHERSKKLGPTGWSNAAVAMNSPASFTEIGSCGNARAAGPNTTLHAFGTSKVDWWHGHSNLWLCFWYNPIGQPTCVQIFEYATWSW